MPHSDSEATDLFTEPDRAPVPDGGA
jgi:hypothetical protein